MEMACGPPVAGAPPASSCALNKTASGPSQLQKNCSLRLLDNQLHHLPPSVTSLASPFMPRTAVAQQLQTSSNLPSEVNSLIEKGSQSWLSKNDVAYILQEGVPALKLRGLLSQSQPHKPSGGSLFLIDKLACRFFRNDGHNYEKRPDGKTVRETHEKLKVGDVELINCYYAHQTAASCDAGQLPLARRCYWLLDPHLGTVVLVHYLNSAKKGGGEEEGLAGSGGRRGAGRKRAASAALESSDGEESASGGSGGRRPRSAKRTAKPARRTKRRRQAESDEEEDTDPEWEDESEDESSFEVPDSESEGEQEQEEGGASEEEDTLWQLEEEEQQQQQSPHQQQPAAAAVPPTAAAPRAPVKPQRPPTAAAPAAAAAAAVVGSPEPHLVYVPRHLLLRRFSSWRLPGVPGCGAGEVGEGHGACAAGCGGAPEQGCGGCGADGLCHCNCAAGDADAAPSAVTADSRQEALAAEGSVASVCGGWQREEELAGRGMGRLESTLDFEGLVEDAFL